MSALSISNKRFITYVLVTLLLIATIYGIRASCILHTFDKDKLVKSKFEVDLTPHINKEETSYTDGCLLFHGIDEKHPLYLRYFSKPYEVTFYISFLHEKLKTNKGRENIRYRSFDDGSDGYVPVVAYDPELQILVFGYSNGIGG
jgi:hypothetical protein